MYHVPPILQCIYGRSDEGGANGGGKEGSNIYERVQITWPLVEVCRRRGLKVNAGKSMVVVLNGEEGFECKISVDGVRLEHVSVFKNWRYVLDESGTDEAVS